MFVKVAIKALVLLVLLAQRSNLCTTREIKTWHMYVSCPFLNDSFDSVDGQHDQIARSLHLSI